MPTTPMVTIGSAKFQLRFFLAEILFNLLHNFAIDPINIPLLITSMLGTTIVSTLVVVIPTLND